MFVFKPLAAAMAAIATFVAPVDGPVTRPYQTPETAYGPGHRGVDFAAPAGAPVRAAAAGTVTFAGPVAGAAHVTVAHGGRLTSSYSYLATVGVRPGQVVDAGQRLGTAGGQGAAHPAGTVHFGVRQAGRYVDPQLFLGLPAPTVRLTATAGRASERGGYTCPTWRSGARNSHARAPSVSATRP